MLRIIVLVLCIAASRGFLVEPRLPGRIVGGSKADIKDIPYQASFKRPGYNHYCGAVIISNKYLLTAAHCVETRTEGYQVSVGSTHTTNGTVYDVVNLVQHENYANLDYDIALLEVNKTIVFNERVQPVKLANVEPKPGEMLTVSGWGLTLDGNTTGSPKHVMKVTVPVVDRRVCRQSYVSIHPVTNNMVCAGYLGTGGKDACSGDSGGPLVGARKGPLYGIVSWGYSCAMPEFPGVYTNVAQLRAWIKKHSGV